MLVTARIGKELGTVFPFAILSLCAGEETSSALPSAAIVGRALSSLILVLRAVCVIFAMACFRSPCSTSPCTKT